MTKYLKLMTYAAVAVAFASPTYADIVNLYEMENLEFYGSDGFGHGQENYTYKCNKSNHEYDHVPAGMICDNKKYVSVTCYINCRCNNDYKYSEDNCNNGLVPGGSSCTNPGTTKKLYTACDCGPDAITESDYNYLSTYFTERSFRTETVDDKTCMFISNPSCKNGHKKFTSEPEDNYKSVLNTRRFAADLVSAIQPIKYSFAASSANPKSNPETVYCLIDTYIQDGFNNAVSFNEGELNATCSNHSNDIALLSDKKFFYYNNVCQTGNNSDISCDVSGVPTAQQSSFSYYDNVTNSVKSITCSYISTSNYCTTNGYKKSCATYEIADADPFEYDTTYKKCIKKEDWCKNNNYKVTESSCRMIPGHTPFNKCPNHSSYYRTCRDNDDICSENYQYCKPTTHVGEGATCQGSTQTYYEKCTLIADWCKRKGFYKSCPNGQVATNESCQYDATYKKCISYADWCKDNNYRNSCPTGYELSGEACPYDSSYKKGCTKKQSETDKCKAQGYNIQCQSGYFNNGESCTGDNNTKWYKTNCTKLSCSAYGSKAYPSNNPDFDCKYHCNDGDRYTIAGSYYNQSYANDGKTMCYKNLGKEGNKTYTVCAYCPRTGVDGSSGEDDQNMHDPLNGGR